MSEMTAKENEILIKLIINLVETSKDKAEAVEKLKALLDTDKQSLNLKLYAVEPPCRLSVCKLQQKFKKMARGIKNGGKK